MNAKGLLGSLLVSLAVVAAYHFVVSRETADSEPTTFDRAVDDLAARVRSIEASTTNKSTLAGRGEPPSDPALEARVVELEERLRQAAERSEAPGGSEPPPLIEAARERARQAVREQEMGLRRQEIRRIDPDLAENDVNEAAALLSDYAQKVKDLYEGKENVEEPERALLHQRYEELSQKLHADLSRCLNSEIAGRLTGRVKVVDSDER